MTNLVAESGAGDRPRVSVIIPTYNNADTLARALGSLAAQDYSNFHVVVVDDCSNDDSMAIAQSFALRYQTIRSIRNEVNLGAVRNYAAGKRFVEGKYFLIGGPDDTWEPSFLTTMVKLLEQRPDAAAAISSVCSNLEDIDKQYFAYPEFNSIYRRHPIRLALAIVKGVRTSGAARSPYYSVIHSLIRSINFDAIFVEDRTFWFVELQLVAMLALLGGIATTDGVLYTRHRVRKSWSERYPNDKLVSDAVRPWSRVRSAFVFLQHAFRCKQLSVGARFGAIPVFGAIILFQILRPLIAPLLWKSLPTSAVAAMRRLTYRIF